MNIYHAIFIVSLCLFSVNAVADTKAPPAQAANEEVKQVKINLNQATLNQLASLKGVGKKKAQAIVQHREQFGQFTSIEELKNVKGIGRQVLKDNLDRLSI